MAGTIRDALAATQNGQVVVAQVKDLQKVQAERTAQLSALVRMMFVDRVPATCKVRVADVFYGSEARVRLLGRNGGSEYDRVTSLVKHAWTATPRSFREACEALGVR